MTNPRVLTVAQVAEQLQVHPRHVLTLIGRGEIAAKNVGSDRAHGARWRIRQTNVGRYLDS